MAHAAPIEQTLAGASLWQSLSTALSTTLARRRAYRATVVELSALTNQRLDDIGLARADIERVARKAARAV